MKKNKAKEKKRKLLVALLMLIFTGIVLTAGTYAWFSANKTVKVENIDVNVAASNGLQISVDGLNFKTLITNSDILDASTIYGAAKNHIPSTMTPVSTIGADSLIPASGFLTMYKGEILSNPSGNNILKTTLSNEAHGTGGDFVAFDLFLQVTQETQVYLTNNSKVTSTDNPSKGIEYASRIAFVYEGYAATGSSLSTIQGLTATSKNYSLASTVIPEGETDPNPQKAVLLWEPNYDVHTNSGLTNATSVYGEAVYGTGVVPSKTDSPRLDYYGVKAEISETLNENAGVLVNSTDSAYFTKVTPDITTTAAGILSSAYQPLLILNPGINKVRVYMWVEGQDVDCENNASGSHLTYSLEFSVNNAA